jgi:hypothetical protein
LRYPSSRLLDYALLLKVVREQKIPHGPALMASDIVLVNLEEGFPSREEALHRLETAIARAHQKHVRVLKIIHGYGSTGVGGILRPVVRNFLRQAKERGQITLFVNGESFSSFESRSKELLHQAPHLLLDKDLGRSNRGITLVLL